MLVNDMELLGTRDGGSFVYLVLLSGKAAKFCRSGVSTGSHVSCTV